jgi:hypothetical protein
MGSEVGPKEAQRNRLDLPVLRHQPRGITGPLHELRRSFVRASVAVGHETRGGSLLGR